jgi:hypothetical protein
VGVRPAKGGTQGTFAKAAYSSSSGDQEKSQTLANSTYPEYVAIQGRRRAAGEEAVQREYNKRELREQDKRQKQRRKERDEEDKAKKAKEDAADKASAKAEEDRANAKAEERLRADMQEATGIHGQNERKGKDEQRREREKMMDASESEEKTEHEVIEWPAVSTLPPLLLL